MNVSGVSDLGGETRMPSTFTARGGVVEQQRVGAPASTAYVVAAALNERVLLPAR